MIVNMPLEILQTPGGVSVTRRTGSYVKGRYVEGESTTFTVTPAVVWSAQKREVERVPEGQRARQMVTILTRVELKCAEEISGGLGDLVVYKGRTYLVVSVTEWEHGNFWEAQAVLQAAA